jgi:hypothetical protein
MFIHEVYSYQVLLGYTEHRMGSHQPTTGALDFLLTNHGLGFNGHTQLPGA